MRPGAADPYPQFVQGEKTPPPAIEDASAETTETPAEIQEQGISAAEAAAEADAATATSRTPDGDPSESPANVQPSADLIRSPRGAMPLGESRGSGMKAVAALTSPERASHRSSYWRARQCNPPAKCAALRWDAQDRLVESEIFADIDPANLSPVQKAWRSE